MSDYDRLRLLFVWRNAIGYLEDLKDLWLEVSDSNWKPAWGLIRGCIEQMHDVYDEMELERAVPFLPAEELPDLSEEDDQ